MKIALITGEFPPMEGGVGAYTQELARALHDLGHELHVITNRQAGSRTARRAFGRMPEPADLGFAQLHAFIDHWRWPSIARIADVTLRYGFDVANIQYQAAAYNMNSPAVNLLPWRIKHLTKTIVTFHDLRTPYLFPKASSLRDRAITFMASQAGGVVATNTADFEELITRVDTPAAQIPIGSNIAAYQPNHIEISEAREQLDLNAEDILLGYFGFLNESKGAETLIEALAQLPDNYHLVFIGGQTGASDETNAAFLAHVREMVSQFGLDERVHWTGFVSDTRVSTFLETADLMVMPYRDGVTLRRGSLMAVLAHGRPLVTTEPLTVVPELVQGENVWLVPRMNASALAQAVRDLVRQPTLLHKLGSGAASLAQQFSWDSIAERTAAFYESIEDPRVPAPETFLG